MTLREYRINELGWSVSKLASEAKVSRQVVSNAENGKGLYADSAKAIADAISRGLNRNIKPLDIEGLNIL